MNVDADDFRKRYGELSDEGLLSINRGELVEVAGQFYDQELAKRGLQAQRVFGSRRPSSRIVKLVALGGLSFWLPDVLIHLVRGDTFGRWEVLLESVVLPLTFLAAYLWTAKRFKDEPRRSVAGLLILGVWLFGGFCMMVDASFAGGGFARPAGSQGAVMLTLAGPFSTYMMSAYDDSLLALLIVSVAALTIFLTGRSKSRQSPDVGG